MNLEGKKTYLIALLIGLLAAARYLHYIDEQVYQTLLGLLAGGGLATLRHGLAKTVE